MVLRQYTLGTYLRIQDSVLVLLLVKFVILLSILSNGDKLSFSFVSTENVLYVKKYIDELTPYIDGSNITFGNHYCDDKVIEDGNIKPMIRGKSLQIYWDLSKSYYDKVYYAEDSDAIKSIVILTLSNKYPNLDLKTFSSNDGIDNLNELLEEYIKNNTHQK